MPAVIVFNSAGGSAPQSGPESGRIRVVEDADVVVEALGGSKTGFAELHMETEESIWIHRESVRMIREARAAGTAEEA
jgi:hypothetical protein